MFIVIVGNPIGGFEYEGPFATNEEACEYGNNHPDVGGDWWVAPLTNERTRE